MSQKTYIRLFPFTVSQWSILFCTWLFYSSGLFFFSSQDFDLTFSNFPSFITHFRKKPSNSLGVQWEIQEDNRNRKPIIGRQQESMSPPNSCSYMYPNNSRVTCQACLIHRYLTEQQATRSALKRIIWKTTADSSLLSRILKKMWSKMAYGKMVQ